MKGRVILFGLVFLVAWFLNWSNQRKVHTYTREMAQKEKSVNALKNIHTELQVEYNDLCSGQNLSSLVNMELNSFIQDKQEERVIYVHEPSAQKATDSYCIVDLIATKAQAKDVQVIPD